MRKLTVKHLNAVRKLIKRYNSISLEEIKEQWPSIRRTQFGDYPNDFFHGKAVAHSLTGFGSSADCTLCISVHQDCNSCIHNMNYAPIYNPHAGCVDNATSCHTMYAIEDAKNANQLLKAFKARANYLQKILDEYQNLIKQ